MPTRRNQIADALRARFTVMLGAGALRAGQRLPSTRALAEEFDADPRVIQAAYRQLETEGLVEMRPRSGSYMAQKDVKAEAEDNRRRWVVETAAQAIDRGIPAERIPHLFRDALTREALHAVVIATTEDQNEGMCKELREDFGVRTSCVTIDDLEAENRTALASADFLVTTELHVRRMTQLGRQLNKPVVIISVRNDPFSGAWRQLLLEPIYIVMLDRRFMTIVQRFFSSTPGAHNLRAIVLGEDDLSTIPAAALVYITHAARQRLGRRKIKARVIPNARIFSPVSCRAILDIMVRANEAASRA